MDGPDLRLWRACAGRTVRIPSSGSKVYYFPQGHAEHASSRPTFTPSTVSAFVCFLDAVRFRADRDTDEVFAELRVTFVPPVGAIRVQESVEGDRALAYAKVLTQSDANNGGGFSVPRQCAVRIFPPLDLGGDLPAQTISVRDVHGEPWLFRHIYRGTPRRHLLTTGWSKFGNSKKFVAGDSIVFLRTHSGEIHVGIRRFMDSGSNDGESGERPRWITPFDRDLPIEPPDDVKEIKPAATPTHRGFSRRKGRFPAASVLETVATATSRQAFTVLYYPGAGLPVFCVEAKAVEEAMKVQWMEGMKFKMEVETEDLSKTICHSGTVSDVSAVDPVCWPNSPWKMLEVTWDEPGTLPNIKRVSPWEIELVASLPYIPPSTFSFQKKKPKTWENPEFDGAISDMIPSLTNYNIFPAGMQGARHDLMFPGGFPAFFPTQTHCIPVLHPQVLQSSFPVRDYGSAEFTGHNFIDLKPSSPKSFNEVQFGEIVRGIENREGSQPKIPKNDVLQLFGATIRSDDVSSDRFHNEASDASRCELDLLSRNQLLENSPQQNRNRGMLQHGKIFEGDLNDERYREDNSMVCKVYKEAERDAPGRAIDLSTVCSYEELFQKLSGMFLIEESLLRTRVFYKGGDGSFRHVGEEPFRGFARTVRKLTIV